MKLENITKRKTNFKTNLDINVLDDGTIVDYIPTFNKGDIVKLIPNKVKYSIDLKLIVGKELVVDKCKIADLGDMLIEVLYLDTSINIKATPKKKAINYIRNPYIVEHFKKI